MSFSILIWLELSCFVFDGRDRIGKGLLDGTIHIYSVPPISYTESYTPGRELRINDSLSLQDPIKSGGDRNQNRTFQKQDFLISNHKEA